MIMMRYFIFLQLTFFSFSSFADVKLKDLVAPSGFEITIFADNLNTPRQITETVQGYVIVGSKKGDKIYALRDNDLDGYAEKQILIADGLQNPTGVTIFEGDLYFAELDTIWIVKNIDEWLSKKSKSLPKKSIYMTTDSENYLNYLENLLRQQKEIIRNYSVSVLSKNDYLYGISRYQRKAIEKGGKIYLLSF